MLSGSLTEMWFVKTSLWRQCRTHCYHELPEVTLFAAGIPPFVKMQGKFAPSFSPIVLDVILHCTTTASALYDTNTTS